MTMTRWRRMRHIVFVGVLGALLSADAVTTKILRRGIKKNYLPTTSQMFIKNYLLEVIST